MSEKKKIIEAIAKAIGGMGKLAKADRNNFDKYDFVSIDKFLAATGQVCSEHGIVIVQNETSREVIVRKDKQWLLIDFAFDVYHTSGESIEGLARSVSVPFTGAQAFGSAQSYALKQFMRSLFQITTGDKDDPDFAANEDARTTPSIKRKPKPKPIGVDTIKDVYRALMAVTDVDEPAFASEATANQWVYQIKQRTIDKLIDDEAAKLIKLVSDKPRADEWDGAMLEAYKTATAITNV